MGSLPCWTRRQRDGRQTSQEGYLLYEKKKKKKEKKKEEEEEKRKKEEKKRKSKRRRKKKRRKKKKRKKKRRRGRRRRRGVRRRGRRGGGGRRRGGGGGRRRGGGEGGRRTPTQAGSLKKLLNRKIVTKYEQEADELAATKKWRYIHKIWAEYKDKPRKEAVANFRLKTGHYCPAANLRKTGRYESH